MKTIVVGYDETEPRRSARLDTAAAFANAFGCVRPIVTSVAPVGAAWPTRRRRGRSDRPAGAHAEELANARAALEAAGVSVETVIAVGEPAEAIVTLAEERGADLIVVGTRELGFMQRMLGQSVSGAVSRQATCDVLIVH